MAQRKFGHSGGSNPIAKTSRDGKHFNAVMRAFVRGDLRKSSGKVITNVGDAVRYADKHQENKAGRRTPKVKNEFAARRLGVGVRELTQKQCDEKRNRAEIKPQSRGGKVRIWPPQ